MNWPMVARTKERNNSNIIVFVNDEQTLMYVCLGDLQKIFMGIDYLWTNYQISHAFRKTSIVAYPAK